jgi:hypothetical protein
MSEANRRNFIGRGVAVAAAATAAAVPGKAQEKATKKVIYRNGKKPEKTPLFNGTVSYGNLIFISGVGYHQEGEIRSTGSSRAWGRRWRRSSSAMST